VRPSPLLPFALLFSLIADPLVRHSSSSAPSANGPRPSTAASNHKWRAEAMRTPARRAAGMEDIRRGRCRATRRSEGACDAIGPETRLSGKADRCRCPCRCPMTTMTPLRLHVLVPSNHASFALVHCSGCSSVVAQRSEAREARHGSTTSSASSSHIHPFTLTSPPPTCSTHEEPPNTVSAVRRQHPNMQREETGEKGGGAKLRGDSHLLLAPRDSRKPPHTDEERRGEE